jgi:hypothetical protein
MSGHNFENKTLAQPWILPIIITSGLASAYAIPWNYTNVPAFDVATTVLPLIGQFVLASLTAVFAFQGKSVWLSLLIATVSLSIVNLILFALDFWGVGLPALPKVLLVITGIALIPALIWGRKKVRYSPPSNGNFETPTGSDW